MKWINISLGIVVATAIAAMGAGNVFQHKANHQLRLQVNEQSKIIDSLLNRRMTVIDCHLHVTDKSRFAIYGRYNKGTITVPNERTYELKIDSTNVFLK